MKQVRLHTKALQYSLLFVSTDESLLDPLDLRVRNKKQEKLVKEKCDTFNLTMHKLTQRLANICTCRGNILFISK